MTWYTPKTWAYREPILDWKLNQQMRDNLDYLYERPRAIITKDGSGADYTTTAVSNEPIDDTVYSVLVVTTGGLVEVNLLGAVYNATAAQTVFFDVLIDDAFWASSGLSIPNTSGLWYYRATVVNKISMIGSPYIYPYALPPGEHTFKLRWRVSGGTGTFRNNAGTVSQFSVKEV